MVDTQAVLWAIPIVMIVVALCAKFWVHREKTLAEAAKTLAKAAEDTGRSGEGTGRSGEGTGRTLAS